MQKLLKKMWFFLIILLILIWGYKFFVTKVISDSVSFWAYKWQAFKFAGDDATIVVDKISKDFCYPPFAFAGSKNDLERLLSQAGELKKWSVVTYTCHKKWFKSKQDVLCGTDITSLPSCSFVEWSFTDPSHINKIDYHISLLNGVTFPIKAVQLSIARQEDKEYGLEEYRKDELFWERSEGTDICTECMDSVYGPIAGYFESLGLSWWYTQFDLRPIALSGETNDLILEWWFWIWWAEKVISGCTMVKGTPDMIEDANCRLLLQLHKMENGEYNVIQARPLLLD